MALDIADGVQANDEDVSEACWSCGAAAACMADDLGLCCECVDVLGEDEVRAQGVPASAVLGWQ